ncbi:MAG: metal ABC transporter ATP-binding protein [Bowdeniella nasicola]|nr:metal ABC transporter ATP-binding protein [Bowdeniella nasicola]
MDAALLTEELQVSYGSTLVVRESNLHVSPGQIVVLTGANGSGKTTLMRACLGLAPRTAGRVELLGVDSRAAVPWHQIGYVPQRASRPPETPTTALEVVQAGLLSGWNLRGGWGPGARRRARERARRALDVVGLAHRAHDPLAVFSGGQTQRVLVARALVRSPKLIFLDEPLAGVDADSQAQIVAALQDLRRSGSAVVVVLHEQGPFAGIVDATYRMDGGRLRRVEAGRA